LKQRRWPDNAEAHRLAAIQAIDRTIRILSHRRQNATTTDDQIAYADGISELRLAKLELVEAKQGRTE
jgi:hypothetical protein